MIGVRRNRNKDSPYVSNRPLTRVELHVHLDGSLRQETVWELAKEKKLTLPGNGTFADLQNYLVVKKPEDLGSFLSRLDIVVGSIKGDLKAIERVAYEFVEDSALSGILYSEARYCPHLLLPDKFRDCHDATGKKWVWDVTEALIKGLEKGQKDFRTKVNLIATCIRGYPKEWYESTLELACDSNFHRGRIAGLDIAALPNTSDEKFMLEPEAIDIFERSVKLGLKRTVHAGESGAGRQVVDALNILHADRIGHGYRIIDDLSIYEKIKGEQVHLECCPWSSLLTGSISVNKIPHPVVQFFQDGFNVSVNTDDPTLTGTKIDDEYRLLSNWGLSEAHFVRGNFNAARSCFLPEPEKASLIQDIAKTLGYTV